MESIFYQIKRFLGRKGDISIEMLVWMAIAFIVLFIMVSIIIASKGKGMGLICSVKNLLGNSAC